MIKVVRKIDVPEEWESTDDWSSHRELLFVAVEHTGGAIVEAGMGEGSTGLLSRVEVRTGRQVYFYESNEDWIVKMSKKYRTFLGSTFVRDWMKDGLFPDKMGLLFVDCAPGEVRKDLIAKYADEAEVILVHDSEEGANYVYGMADILSTFKYRLDYRPEGKPSTTAVSNHINVCEWLP